MNEHGKDDHEQQYAQTHADDMTETNALEKRISQFFHAQADQIYLKPELRHQIFNKLPTKHQHQQKRMLWTGLAAVAIFAIVLALLLPHFSVPATVHYTTTKEVNVAPTLSDGGRLISLDPTEQHIVYQPANQEGVLYMADVASPLQSNTLVMRNEQNMTWAPDGSALVAIISAPNTKQSLLALVPQGQYMHLLGPIAQAANWSPTNNNQIMYVQQNNQSMQIWSIDRSGMAKSRQIQIQTSLHAQQMIWSPDGHHLALIVTDPSSTSNEGDDQPNRAIYMVDIQSGKFTQLVAPGNFTLGTVAWSPDGQHLAYEQVNPANTTLLKMITMTGQIKQISIVLQHQLIGWSWAPDSTALVYSDGGTLKSYAFTGLTRTFPTTYGKLDSPFWLKNGQILCMSIINGKGQLATLTPQS